MPVFDNSIKVALKVQDPGTDKTLSGSGALSWGGITTPVGLGGCTGIDAKLVHGDRWQQIEQTLTTNILANELRTVFQNQTLMVMVNRTKTVLGNLLATIIGAHNLLQVGAQNETHVEAHNRLNASPESQAEPTNKFRMFGIEFEVKGTESTITGSKMEITGNSLEVTGLSNALIGISNEIKGIDMCTAGMSVEPKGLEVELKALKTIGEGAEVKAAAGVAAVAPSVNAIPHAPMMGGT